MSVANIYAKALYESVKDSNGTTESLNQLETEMETLVKVIDSSREAQSALYGPTVTAKEKIGIIEAFSQKLSLSPRLRQFLSLLATKGRMRLLPGIREAFSSVRLIAEGGIPGKLVAAEPVEDSDVQSLAKAFSKKLGKPVTFQVSIDPQLLAGMKVTVNGVTYDGTLRSQLQQLRDRLMSAPVTGGI